MKFLQLTIAAFVAALLLAFPSFANNPWEGEFTKVTKHSDGTWTAMVVVHGTGEKIVKRFKECIRSTKMCRNQIEGGAPADQGGVNGSVADTQSVHSGKCRNTSSTTCYAIFNPRYTHGDNIFNTESNPQIVDDCKRAGSSKCILVQAPLHDWQAANNTALDQTGWGLQRF